MAVKKFLKFDSEKGYLDNKDDINYFATSQMQKVAFGKMLGDFDENGLYVINQKIVEELIKMPKVIVEMVEEADLIRSKVKADSFFHFILTIEDNKASFKLLEKLHYQSNRDFNAGAYSNINEYVIDEMIVPDKDFDRNALYQKYNISTENDGEVLSIFDMDELSIALYYNIVEKLKTNYLVQNQLVLKEKEIENIEADYFEAMLGALGEFEEFGGKVKTELKKDLAEKHSFVIVSKPFFQKTVNEVLNSLIEQYITDLSEEQKQEFLTKVRDIKANYYQRFKTLLPIEIAQKSGVRFDANQVVQEGLIGSLAQEIVTKGYTSSDVRKFVINDSELQLSIAKIKEQLSENEEYCKRDNAKAKDITKGRKLVNEFYKELEAENQVSMLTPDTTLIKSAIGVENTAKTDKASTATVASSPKKEVAPVKKPPAKVTKSNKTENKKQGKTDGKKDDKKKDKKEEKTKENTNKQEPKKNQIEIYGVDNQPAKQEEDALDGILDDVIMAYKYRDVVDVKELEKDEFNIR